MTDVSKAMELLELEENWLEPFDLTDPFSNLQLEGYLSLKPDYRYGSLALLKVGGKEAPQRILATPKLPTNSGASRFKQMLPELRAFWVPKLSFNAL